MELLGLPKVSLDAQRLLQWRDPTKGAPRSASGGGGALIGEFTVVLYDVLQHRVGKAWSNYSVGEVTNCERDGRKRERRQNVDRLCLMVLTYKNSRASR